MSHGVKIYLALTVVFLLSILSSYIVPTNQIIKGIFASPAILALIGALYQIARDQAAFEKQKYFDDRKRIFEIGATSHMANTTFDKHVAFCEEYMQEVHSTVFTLFREGPSKDALIHADNSLKLRQKYAAWLTEEISTNLEPYEKTIREIGAWAGFVESTVNSSQNAELRAQKIKEIYQKFSEVLSLDNTQEVDASYAIEAVKKKIREILGIEELTRIRKYLINEAIRVLNDNT